MYFSSEWIQVFFYPQTNDLLCCPQKVTTLTKSIPFTSFCVQEHGKKAQGTLLTSHTKWVIFFLSSMWCWSILWIAIFPGKCNAATELLLTHWCTGKPLYRKTVQTVPPHCCQMSEQWEILHTKRWIHCKCTPSWHTSLLQILKPFLKLFNCITELFPF